MRAAAFHCENFGVLWSVRGNAFSMIIDGKAIAREIVAALKPRIAALAPRRFFGALIAGNDPASLHFLKQKEKVAGELGIKFRLYERPETMTTDELRREIGRLAGVKTCGGFIVQLPLPEHINRHYALNAIPKEKDVDFLSEAALGAFYTGRSKAVPPAVGTTEEILRRERVKLREARVVLIGAGFLIGKPVGFWLQNRVAELTVIDSAAPHLRAKLKDADVVISGAGCARLFSAADVKDNALVIDFGFNKLPDGKIVGDFDPSEKREAKSEEPVYTPTPGGTGPILVAKLFENFCILNE